MVDIRSPIQRKALFREMARDIVRADRLKRKYEQSVDTAGAIARALEETFRLGLRNSDHELGSPLAQRQERPSEWLEVPPLPRKALWSICIISLGTETPPRAEVPLTISRTGNRWIDGDGGDVVSDRGIRPLVRLGLLEPIDESGRHLRITALARDIWYRAVAKDRWLSP
jgi:hypothetical protein